MQASCPQCGNKITIDDARAPDKPFAVKCPKCQTSVRFPGKGAAASAAAAESGPAAEAPSTPRREPTGEKALVGLGDRSQTNAITLVLTHLGYTVDPLEDLEEGSRLLEQGVYDVAVAAPTMAQPGKPETLYQRVNRLTAEGRRRLFLILVADNVKTGDGTQAWALQADMVVTTKDLGACDKALLQIAGDRKRMYQCFLEAQRRHEAAGG